MRPITLISLLLFVLLGLVGGPAWAGSPIHIELNKLEPQEDACRAYFVLENGTDSSFSAFTMDLYIFDRDGVVAKRFVVESAPLTPEKTRVRPVDLRGLTCEGVTMVLLNDIMKCTDASGERGDCLDILELSNRTSAKFFK